LLPDRGQSASHRQLRDPRLGAGDHGASRHIEAIRVLAGYGFEERFKPVVATRTHKLELQSERASGGLEGRLVDGVGGVKEDGDPRETGYSLLEYLERLASQTWSAQPGDVAAGPSQAADDPRADQVAGTRAHDGNHGGSRLRGGRNLNGGDDDDLHFEAHQLDRQRLDLFGVVAATRFDHQVLPVDIAQVLKTLSKG